MAWEHRAVAASDIDELVEFAEALPAADLGDRPRRFLTGLVSGPDAIFDFWRAGRRQAVSIILDTHATGADAADFMFVAHRELPDDALVRLAFDLGIERARVGPRGWLEAALTPDCLPHEPMLRARGFVDAYSLYEMTRAESAPTPGDEPLPDGFAWSDVNDDCIAALHAVTVAAFSAVPGAGVSAIAEFRQNVLGRRPPTRVLSHLGEVAGFAGIVIDPERPDHGVVRAIGLHPGYRRRGLGSHLIAEAIRRLRAAGARELSLEVAAGNSRALRLYRQFGFAVARELRVLKLPLRAAPA
jgi:ribosomal protein S18 acetylase RimI-like enzyme